MASSNVDLACLKYYVSMWGWSPELFIGSKGKKTRNQGIFQDAHMGTSGRWQPERWEKPLP